MSETIAPFGGFSVPCVPYNDVPNPFKVTLYSPGASVQELREALVEAAVLLERMGHPEGTGRKHAAVIRALLAKPEVVTNG